MDAEERAPIAIVFPEQWIHLIQNVIILHYLFLVKFLVRLTDLAILSTSDMGLTIPGTAESCSVLIQ